MIPSDFESNHIPREVIVMCYASSGSSCVAGVLHHLGINMGMNLKKAQQLNPKGFYEDEDFFNVLGKIWSLYYIYSKSRHEWDAESLWKIGRKYRHEFQAMILKRQNQGTDWGVKEPRLSLLVPIFKKSLRNPFFIVVNRDIENHTISYYNKVNNRFSRQRFSSMLYYLKKRHYSTLLSNGLGNIKKIGMTQDETKYLVKSFYTLVDAMITAQPHMHLNFDALLAQPEKMVNEIISFLSLSPAKQQIDAAISFISPELRHYQ